MEDIREIVAKNISALRKANDLTQVELAQKINFSDKAVSRWEKGEVLPDLETLQKLSEVFNVSIHDIIEVQEETKEKNKIAKYKQEILSRIFLVCEIWTILSVAYAYLNVSDGLNVWMIFLWGVPATAFILFLLNLKEKHSIVSFVLGTIFIWSFTACLFLQMINFCPWYFFILGVPIQGMLIVKYIFNYNKKNYFKKK